MPFYFINLLPTSLLYISILLVPPNGVQPRAWNTYQSYKKEKFELLCSSCEVDSRLCPGQNPTRGFGQRSSKFSASHINMVDSWPTSLSYISKLLTSCTTSRGFGWRIHCGVEVTESSTNKQLYGSRTQNFSVGICQQMLLHGKACRLPRTIWV